MKKLLCAFVVLAALSCQLSAEPEATRNTVEAIGIQIAFKGFEYDEKWNKHRQLPFNMQNLGLEVAMALSCPAGGIIKLDRKKGTILSFKDNLKTDLLAKPANTKFGNEPGFGSFPKISKDGKRVTFSVKTPNLPAKGAQSLAASGTVALLTGSTKETAEAKDVKLETGSKLVLGPFSFEIGKVGKPDWGDAAMAVELKTNKRLDAMVTLSFHGPDGADLKARGGGGSSMSFGGMVKVTKGFNFKKQVTTPVTIRMVYWSDMKEITVPFSVKVGLMPVK